MQDSHTSVSTGETTTDADPDSGPLRLVSVATAGLPQRLAGRIDEHLAVFVAHLRQGLLAASTAVGLEVLDELMEVEVTELVGAKGKHNPGRTAMRHGHEQGTVTLGGATACGPPAAGPLGRRGCARAGAGILPGGVGHRPAV